MGFTWIFTLILAAWAFFVLGRKYQDLQDVLLARRVTKLIEQRKQVAMGKQEWEEVESVLSAERKAAPDRGAAQ